MKPKIILKRVAGVVLIVFGMSVPALYLHGITFFLEVAKLLLIFAIVFVLIIFLIYWVLISE